MPEPFYRRDYGLGTVEEQRKKTPTTYSDQSLQNKTAFMRNTDVNKTRGLLSAFERSSKAKEGARKKEVQPQKNPWELPIPGGGIKKPTGRDGSFPSYDKDKDKGDGGGTTPSGDKGIKCTGGQVLVNGVCQDPDDSGVKDKCAGKSLTCPSDRPKGQGVCDPATGNVSYDNCKPEDTNCPGGCPEGQHCENGKCVPNDDGGNGGEGPSLKTIIKPDETPMLQSLTNEMDLRNMLSNVLNKNNPLFKQARTRALQAMAGRGIVNSSMAEEAVMNAVMNVAMPIATRVIDDLQRVMAANVNASNAFKQAVNAAYYSELLARVDAANNWNLERMKSQQVNWQKMLEAKTGAAGISDKGVFEEYMNMLKTQPGYGASAPIWNATS